MPRNGSSVYSLPAGNPVIPGTTISSTWANTTLSDIATALTQSLSTDGSTATVSLSGKTLQSGTYDSPTISGTADLSGGQIKFPAVQIPSANANTLDDYEEGSWTPTITFATPGNVVVLYSQRVGNYTKIGNRVDIWFTVVTSTFTHTTASGALRLTGLPFTSLTGTDGVVRSSGFSVTVGTAFDTMTCTLNAASSFLEFTISAVNGGNSALLSQLNHVSGNNMVLVGHIVMRTS